jgi:hypothetical protein
MKTTSKSSQERNIVPTRHGNHATIYGVRRDPKLADKNIIIGNEEKRFPYIGAATYRGDWFDNKKSGFGTQINQDRSKYEGEFRDNLYHGSGTMWIQRDQKIVKEYSGNWEKGKRGGLGTLYVDNGDVYEGEWLANKRSGEGRLDNPNGDYFIGNWHDNVQNGYGTMAYKNGNIFEGVYKNGVKSGPGRYFYATTRKVVIISSFETPFANHEHCNYHEGHLLLMLQSNHFVPSYRITRANGQVMHLAVESTGNQLLMKRSDSKNQKFQISVLSCRS